jgi:hypothetical protein
MYLILRGVMVMSIRSIKLKAVVVGVVCVLYTFLTSPSVQAEASTIKNGVSCKKLNQSIKVGSKRYTCGKNPYVSPSKLTWMLRECPQTYELYIESKDQYEIFKDILNSSGAEGKVEAEKLIKGIGDLEVLMKTQVCKRGK